jgi:hypothetical protein
MPIMQRTGANNTYEHERQKSKKTRQGNNNTKACTEEKTKRDPRRRSQTQILLKPTPPASPINNTPPSEPLSPIGSFCAPKSSQPETAGAFPVNRRVAAANLVQNQPRSRAAKIAIPRSRNRRPDSHRTPWGELARGEPKTSAPTSVPTG